MNRKELTHDTRGFAQGRVQPEDLMYYRVKIGQSQGQLFPSGISIGELREFFS